MTEQLPVRFVGDWGGLVVSMLDCQSRVLGFKSWPGQKFSSRFLIILLPLVNSDMTSTLTVSGKMGWWGIGLATRPHIPFPGFPLTPKHTVLRSKNSRKC